jgi:uncharacterized paraquat-inducible protein A
MNTADDKERFQRNAKSYRKIGTRENSALLSLVITAGLAFLVPSIQFYAMIAASISLLFVGYFQVCRPKVTCWNCGKDIDGITEDFCPGCGFQWLKAHSEDNVPECNRCNTAMLRPRGSRRYKVSYCTRCGMHLTDEPL